MKVFVPTNKKHPSLILCTSWPSHDFLDNLQGNNWLDFSDDSSVGSQDIAYCSIKYLSDLYDNIRKAMRSHYKYKKSAENFLNQSCNTPQTINYRYWKDLHDKFKDWSFERHEQNEFWQRCQDELVVKEYNINPFTMEIEPVGDHEFRSLAPQKPSVIY